MRVLFAVLLAGGVLVVTSVNAAPITVEFSGTITHYSDLPNSTPISDRIGASIYGYLIYNVANAETSRVESAPNGGGVNGVASKSGCENVFNGVCQNDWGTDKPVVTEYRIFTPWGTISNLEGDYATSTEFGFTRSSPNPPPSDVLYERVDATRDDRRYTIFADGTASEVVRQFGFALFNYFSQGVLFGDLWDLTQLPSAEPIPPGDIETRLQLWNVASTCLDAYGHGCVSSADNFWMVANLSEVDFRRGVHRVPEPGSLVLLGLGLAGLAFTRRSKHWGLQKACAILLAGALAGAVSATASAAIITGSFDGEIFSGTSSLVGKSIQGSFIVNTNLLTNGEGCDLALQYNCGSGAYSVEITHVIDGVELKYSEVFGYVKVVDRYPTSFEGLSYDQLYLQVGSGGSALATLSIISFDNNFITDLDYLVSFGAFTPFFDNPYSGYNSHGIGSYSDVSYAFRITSVSAGVSSNGDPHPVPEPGTLTLLGLGLAGLAFTRRRKQ